MPDLVLFLDANILFTAAYSPEGLSALLIDLGIAGRVRLLTSALAVAEAERNIDAKRPSARSRLERSLAAVDIVLEPAPADVVRLTPADLAAKDRPLLAAAISARAAYFVTGDVRDFGRWMSESSRLSIRIVTPRQFFNEGTPR